MPSPHFSFPISIYLCVMTLPFCFIPQVSTQNQIEEGKLNNNPF